MRNFLFLPFFLFFSFAVQAALNVPIPAHKPMTDTPLTSVKKREEEIKTRTAPPPAASFQISETEKPLNKKDAELYREIYRLQHVGKFNQARTLISKIDNTILMGHIHAQRLFHTKSNATDKDFRDWLDTYSDHPQSIKIAKKIKNKSAASYKNRVTGTMGELRYFANGSKYLSSKYSAQQRRAVNNVRREIRESLHRGSATAALHYFNKHGVQRYIDPVDKSQILSSIASVYLYLNHPEKARMTALKALKASKETPIPGWILGLTAWINKDFKSATKYFTLASKAPYASPWMTSAASYWGARSATRAKLFKEVSPLLATAVKYQRTFYGLIATKALGYGYDFNWTMPAYTPKMQNVLQQHPAGARAVALAEINQLTMAESELFALPVKNNNALQEAALSLAQHYNLAGYSMRFSSIIPNPAGGFYDAGLFPISSWTKEQKNSDIPLLNAFIRQESRFISTAKNPTGATGLMQVMPETAAFITEDSTYKTKAGRSQLQNPRINVNIGANYLKHLMSLEAVNNDLFGLAIAYNAGPGKLGRWKREIKERDPLLFIELIPSSETRSFVERVATNYWVYQMRSGNDPHTLTAIASGDWPRLD
ncbi:MAG: hypothetical protein COB76_06755 [Alphaproteobacteria bacterium]|nr:MAG: hypothetical protein COB76_06755 [Alphaproteobacteria bacterium]